MNKIAHLTSVHPRYDTRIFHKECFALFQSGYDVNLIVSDNLGDETINGIKIIDVGKKEGRFSRFTKTVDLIYQKAIEIDADLYHFHDPELIRVGSKLKKIGKKVIYDVHEDVPLQLKSKHYLPNFSKPLISSIFNRYEKKNAGKFDGIITATDFIQHKFLPYNANTIDINNYPAIGALSSNTKWQDREDSVLYIGSINKYRGTSEVIKSLELINQNITFYLGGNFSTQEYFEDLQRIEGYKKVKFVGYADKKMYKELCRKVKIGIITDHPLDNYLDAYATKMYEYMDARIPFICSDFPNWKKLVGKYNCGFCVDPFNLEQIAEAIKYLINNPAEAEKMGENGRKAVEENFNWLNEEKRLLTFYNKIIHK